MHGDTGMCPGRCSGFQLVDDAPTGTWVFGVNLPENALRFLLLSVERRCTAIRRFADIHDRSLSRENEVLPTSTWICKCCVVWRGLGDSRPATGILNERRNPTHQPHRNPPFWDSRSGERGP